MITLGTMSRLLYKEDLLRKSYEAALSGNVRYNSMDCMKNGNLFKLYLRYSLENDEITAAITMYTLENVVNLTGGFHELEILYEIYPEIYPLPQNFRIFPDHKYYGLWINDDFCPTNIDEIVGQRATIDPWDWKMPIIDAYLAQA